MSKPQQPNEMPSEFYTSGSYTFYALWLRGQGREEEAAEVFREAARRQNTHQAHFGLGISLLTAGKAEEAVAEFEEAIRLKSDWASAYDALGRALDAVEQYGKAVATFKEGLRLSPDYYAMYIHMGNAYKHQGDLQSAIQAYRNAAEGYTERSPNGHICLADALLEIGSYAEAIAILTPLSEKFPNWAEIHQSMGNALLAVGRIAEAQGEWQRVLAIREEFVAKGLGNQELEAFARQAQDKLRASV